jgi:cellulose synthase operon protein C
MTDDLQERLQRAHQSPYGKARSALIEDVVRRADAADDDELGFFARLSLVTAYVMGGEPRKSLVPFSRCVADWDADPARYANHSHLFHWCFKYAPSTLTKFPEVPLDQAYAVLDDMERRWLIGGHSLHAVHQLRWQVASHLGDAEAAAEHFRLWSTTPRDDLSDCAGCGPTQKVIHLIRTGDAAQAVALAVGVLDGQLTCDEQPQHMLTALLPAYVAEGMHAEAVAAHRRAYRILRGRPGELDSYAGHILFCARTGNETKAVELVERHLSDLADPPTPFAEMEFAAAASLALRRLADSGENLLIRQPRADEIPADRLADDLAGRALALAERFDARNGTDHQSDQVRATLTAEPWIDYLPLSETARRVQLRAQARRVAEISVPALPVGGEVADESEPTRSGWLDRAEAAWQNDDREGAIAAWRAFEESVPDAERTPLERARVLDARGLAAATDEDGAPVEAWREALALYAELGEEIRLLRDRARIGMALCRQGEVDEGVASGEEPLRRLIENDEPPRQAHWHFCLAMMLAQAGRTDEALQELTALRRRPGTKPELLAHAANFQCHLLVQLGRLPEAEEAATAGLETADDLARSAAYRQRGWIRGALERPAEAVDDLEEAIALAAGTAEADLQVALCRMDLSKAYLAAGRSLESAETAEEALSHLMGPDLVDPRLEVRRVLVDAYRELGELEPALAQVRKLLEEVPEDAHPRWLGFTRQDEGVLLERLDRDLEAVDVFLDAAAHFEQAELPIEHVQALRLAGQSARYAGELTRVEELLTRAQPVLDALPEHDERVLFQQAGVQWDRAVMALDQGETAAAVELADRAAAYYERGGHEGQALNARLLQAEHGALDETALRVIFDSLPIGDRQWHRAGWLLVDHLRALGREPEADSLESQLTTA